MSKFKPVERDINFPATEEVWLNFWKENDIFEKQLAQSKARAKASGKPTYVFYEGPPTANGMPHPGHVLTRVVKDLFPRFRAMQGYDVPRKAGWDTHGLPVEVEVEKTLGFDGKHDVEKYGVEPFVKKCKDSVFKYSEAWRTLTERIAFWVDLDDPYVTFHQSYIESVWWSLKQIWDAGLIYHGAKIVPWCTRCGTALSSQEVGQGYKEVEDPSAFVAFRSKEDANVLFLAWTTTPWTLLSNVALAVGADFDYDYVKVGDETLVMASALREKAMGKVEHEVVKTVKGSELVGREYEQLFKYAEVDKPAFRIVAGDFVGLDAGSGIVHIAPAFGEDDYRIGQENDLPTINVVRPDGTFMDVVEPWKGVYVKDADRLILKELKERNQLLKSERYKHDYPFCWRCDSPLLYYPRPAWYIRTSQFKDKLVENNRQITWHPEHIKEGRFGNFLEGNVDWALSRERFWGTPLPIWTCVDCGHQTAVGSEAELRDQAYDREKLPEQVELHKPYVDNVELVCAKCDGRMKRVPEVIDCWYDSGSMPFAQWGYPYKEGSEDKLRAALPADFISEAIDQTRGWFYSLLAISTMLKECARIKSEKGEELGGLAPWNELDYPLPYKRCLVLGLLLAKDGLKLSKSKKNYPDPFEVFEKEGADAMRWFFYFSNNPWTSTRFFEEGIREAQKDFLIRLRNVFSFFVIYANIDGFDPTAGLSGLDKLTPESFSGAESYVPLEKRSLLDRWMISKLESATAEATKNLEEMNILLAARSLYDLVDMLSNWFVRRSRDRFWKSEKNEAKWAAYWTLYECLTRISLLIAPFTPYMAEELYQKLVKDIWGDSMPLSVHLCEWPVVNDGSIDLAAETQMDMVREIASLGLAARAAEKQKVRQPLAQAVIILSEESVKDSVNELAGVIREEINVKEIVFAHNAADYVDYTVKPNFKALGPKLGSNVKLCAGALAKADSKTVVEAIQNEGRYVIELNGESVELNSDELDVRISAKEGFAAASGRGVVVVLDTSVTPELELEGLAREVVNRIQNIRKELDLAYEARISVRLEGQGRVLEAAEKH
ncbi:MAG: isoleucine--tRNA ligase, partial [Planctomycetes bacterium]|nr:isoleucine--tRNA ligase [Planctomycetota bacterium]